MYWLLTFLVTQVPFPMSVNVSNKPGTVRNNTHEVSLQGSPPSFGKLQALIWQRQYLKGIRLRKGSHLCFFFHLIDIIGSLTFKIQVIWFQEDVYMYQNFSKAKKFFQLFQLLFIKSQTCWKYEHQEELSQLLMCNSNDYMHRSF